uniref:Uncharacterized protein n=1 Tax=Anguilla anguilla TaxID=7936 RepID=A0A0E9SL65_ANGAN
MAAVFSWWVLRIGGGCGELPPLTVKRFRVIGTR